MRAQKPMHSPSGHLLGDCWCQVEKREAESHLIGRGCDQIDRANPDLPIEECQAIARDIITLVREYS